MKTMMCAIVVLITLATVGYADFNGFATWFTVESCRREETSGITASGRRLDDSALWCALPFRPPLIKSSGRRAWGRKIRVTNQATGRSIVVEQWDVGPGRRARARNVVVDLTPAAFLSLGGRLQDGRLAVRVELL
jgi:hypothetical protein